MRSIKAPGWIAWGILLLAALGAVLSPLAGSGIQSIATISAANLTASINTGAALHEKGGRWSITTTQGTGSQATITKASGGSGVRHVADCISFSASAVVAPALTFTTVSIIDGATGGTAIWRYAAALPATTGNLIVPHSICGLSIVGSAATGMTVEFSAGAANAAEVANLSGYDVQ